MTATMHPHVEDPTDGLTTTSADRAEEVAARWAQDVWIARARRLAASAERAVLVFPEVASARFAIDGGPAAPTVDIDCTVLSGEDTEAVIETITCKVVADLEQLLDARFATRRINVQVAAEPVVPGIGVVELA